jgi:hypothetical protein
MPNYITTTGGSGMDQFKASLLPINTQPGSGGI